MLLLIINEINDDFNKKITFCVSHACIRRWKFAVKLNWEFKLPKSQQRMMMHAIQFESIVRIVMKAPRGSERENDLREVKEFFHHLCTHAISLHSLFIPNHHIEFKEREKWAERDGSVHLCCIIEGREISIKFMYFASLKIISGYFHAQCSSITMHEDEEEEVRRKFYPLSLHSPLPSSSISFRKRYENGV